jgi:hypothetical protein
MGTAFQAPLCFSYLAAAKYFESGQESYVTAYAQLGQLMGHNNNPNLEAGGAYFARSGDTYLKVSAGLAYGNGVSYPPIFLKSNHPCELATGGRLLPLVSLAGGTEQGTVSVLYYHGLTDAAFDTYERIAEAADTVVLTIDSRNGDSIRLNANGNLSPAFSVVLSNGEAVEFREPIIGMFGELDPEMQVRYHVPTEYKAFSVGNPVNLKVMIKAESLEKLMDSSERIEIRRYGGVLEGSIESVRGKTSGFTRDLSIGFGITRTNSRSGTIEPR